MHPLPSICEDPPIPQKYRDWINLYYPTSALARAQCGHAVHKMIEDFPGELIACPGHVRLADGGGSEHWWAKIAATGQIVDPTMHQWPHTIVVEYIPWPEDVPIPVGKCMDCGDLTYNPERPTFCNEACERQYLAYLKAECGI